MYVRPRLPEGADPTRLAIAFLPLEDMMTMLSGWYMYRHVAVLVGGNEIPAGAVALDVLQAESFRRGFYVLLWHPSFAPVKDCEEPPRLNQRADYHMCPTELTEPKTIDEVNGGPLYRHLVCAKDAAAEAALDSARQPNFAELYGSRPGDPPPSAERPKNKFMLDALRARGPSIRKACEAAGRRIGQAVVGVADVLAMREKLLAAGSIPVRDESGREIGRATVKAGVHDELIVDMHGLPLTPDVVKAVADATSIVPPEIDFWEKEVRPPEASEIACKKCGRSHAAVECPPEPSRTGPPKQLKTLTDVTLTGEWKPGDAAARSSGLERVRDLLCGVDPAKPGAEKTVVKVAELNGKTVMEWDEFLNRLPGPTDPTPRPAADEGVKVVRGEFGPETPPGVLRPWTPTDEKRALVTINKDGGGGEPATLPKKDFDWWARDDVFRVEPATPEPEGVKVTSIKPSGVWGGASVVMEGPMPTLPAPGSPYPRTVTDVAPAAAEEGPPKCIFVGDEETGAPPPPTIVEKTPPVVYARCERCGHYPAPGAEMPACSSVRGHLWGKTETPPEKQS